MSIRRTRADRQAAIAEGIQRHMPGSNRADARRAAKAAARAPVAAKVAPIAQTAQAAAPAPVNGPAETEKKVRRLKIGDNVRMAVAAMKRKPGRQYNFKQALLDGSAFAPYEPMKGVLPKGTTAKKMIAMDADFDAPGLVAGTIGGLGAWAGDALNISFAEGIGFLGYSYLAALTQRAEYRKISERTATEMTRKWIKFSSVSSPEEDFEATGPEARPGTPAGAMGVPADPEEAEASTAATEADETRERVQQSVKRKKSLDKQARIKELEEELRRLKVKDAFYTIAEGDGWFGRYHLYLDLGTEADAAEEKTPIGNGSPKSTISRAKVNKRKKLKAVRPIEPMWCYPAFYNSINPRKPDWYNPEHWYVNGATVHRSRLLRFVGREVPDILKPAYAFGGLSMSQMAKPYVDNWLRTRQAVCDLIESFSVSGVYSNLTGILEEGQAEAVTRIEIFNEMRANAGVWALDKETEEYFNVSTPLGTLDKLQAQSQEQMSSVSGIPLIILLGITPTGLNASSEGEIRAFYDTIQAWQEQFFRDHLQTVIWFVMRSLWGEVDEDITFEFVPLWSMTDKEKSEIRKIDAETGGMLIDKGVITNAEERTRVAQDPNSLYQSINPADAPEMPSPDMGGGDGDDPFGGGDDEGGDGGGESDKSGADKPVGGSGANDEWKEGDHPRADDGKFGAESGSSSASSTSGRPKKGSESSSEAGKSIAMSSLKKTGKQMGSNAGGVYTHENGDRYYVKKPATKAHVDNELAAARLYKLAGVNTLDYVPIEGGEHVATKFEKLDKNNISQLTPAERKEAAKDFGVHAWLSNWDAAGTGGDNQGIRGGKVTTLDVGGSLRYRAQGGDKGKAFGSKVSEIDSMRDKGMSPDAARLFGGMSEEELRDSVMRVTSIPDAKIRAAAGDDKLADTLIARKKDLAQRFNTIATDDAIMQAALDSGADGFEDDDTVRTEEEIENAEEPGESEDLANDDDGVEEVAEDVFVMASDENQFDESKHKRDSGGKFSSTGGGGEGGEADGEKKPEFKSKKEHIGWLLTHGTTPKDLMTEMGWPSVSMPAQAASLGMKLEKKDGKYFGVKMTDAELADAKKAAAEKAKQKSASKTPVPETLLGSPAGQKGHDWATAQLPPNGPPKDFAEFKDYVTKAEAAGNTGMVDNLKNFNPSWAKQLDLPAPPADGGKPKTYPEFLGSVAELAQAKTVDKPAIIALFKDNPKFAADFKANAQPKIIATLEKAIPGVFDTKPKAPQATEAELKKAKKGTTFPINTSNAEGVELIKEFNEKYAGKELTDPEALNQKVQDFKDLQANLETANAKSAAEAAAAAKKKQEEAAAKAKAKQQEEAKAAKAKKEEEDKRLAEKFAKDPDLKTHYEAMEALFGGKKTSQAYRDAAEKKVKAAGLSKHITPEAAVPIMAYSGSHYGKVNEELRGENMSVEQFKFMKSLNAGLDRLPAYEGVTYRKASLSPSQFKAYVPGRVVQEQGFTSTSKNKGTWSGSYDYTIHGKSGRDIQKLSSHPSEAEVLFRAGTRFYVESVNGQHITLREL